MYFIEDEHFAKRLQTELQAYENFKRQKESTEKENLNPVDSKLEYIDPTPSIHDLFVKFDKKFFWNSLGMVQVLWSNKMTKCAGMCSFEGGRGLCKISLSAPLLSLRPRKDLVETLLHEMIHAYLFVTHNYKDREDHGPEFHKHMYRINKEAGTNITVYHTFYDEVEYYQKHIWRCNGPCQKQKPYFGFVRRAINRPPGPSDTWWSKHQAACGGTFIKISEPEKTDKKIRKPKVIKSGDKNKDIRDFFSRTSTSGSSTGENLPSNVKTFADFKNKPVGGVKTNAGTGTIVITSNNKGKSSKTKSNNQSSRKEITNHKNKSPNLKQSDNGKVISGNQNNGYKLKDSKESSKSDNNSDDVKQTVRNVWANKFSASTSSEKKSPDNPNPKKLKMDNPVCIEGISGNKIQKPVDECLVKKNVPNTSETNLTAECSNSDNSVQRDKLDEMKHCPVCGEDILQSEMNNHLENCLSCSFENEGEDDFGNDIVCESVPCPCCYKWFQESEMNSHIDECLTLCTLKEEILAS